MKIDKGFYTKIARQHEVYFQLVAKKYYENGKGKQTATIFDDYAELGCEIEMAS